MSQKKMSYESYSQNICIKPSTMGEAKEYVREKSEGDSQGRSYTTMGKKKMNIYYAEIWNDPDSGKAYNVYAERLEGDDLWETVLSRMEYRGLDIPEEIPDYDKAHANVLELEGDMTVVFGIRGVSETLSAILKMKL